MRITQREALSFDDVLLEPLYSEVSSRKSVDLSMSISSGYKLSLPVIASPMDTVTGIEMAKTMAENGGMGIIHRYSTIEEQVNCLKTLAGGFYAVGAAVGATGDFYERAQACVHAGATLLCVDIAHGHHRTMVKAMERLRSDFPLHIMAGNVSSATGFRFLQDLGADSIRVGVGGGSCCTTRIVSGHGVPTLESLMRISNISDRTAGIIADGGIRNTGDMVKCFAAGANAVMIGSMLAGTDETPGEIVNGQKVFRGMASAEAQTDWRGAVSVAEGVATTVPCKGPVVNVLNEIKGGLGSGCSYTGVNKLSDLHARAIFVKQSNHGATESRPHILEKP